MRPTRPVPTALAAGAALVFAFASLTACSGGAAENPEAVSRTGPGAPGGTAPAPGSIIDGTKGAVPDTRPPGALSGRELADRAVQLMAATSYKLTGSSGAGADAVTLTIEVSKQRDAVQTVAGVEVKQELIRVGGVVYTNVESVIGATPGAQIPASLRGMYLKADGQQLDPKLVDPFAGTFAGAVDVAKGAETQVDGKNVWPLTVKSADGSTTTMFVMASGDPFPIRMTVAGGAPLDLKVSDFGADVRVVAPPADRVLDQAALQQRLAGA
ncbi:hypothetical protein [Yinghuangia soli]|uniref:Lipoprotein n=1 Tax=Yinghuangia soli TaxID=2908204 RepID=A0AA41Q2Q7_9ACTN|nr:hypothetical protein [Yinghuangia soli]MCF2529880.1 hypothetical protein [Yinghuangia soli]